jgi:hypothetical protein
MPQTGSESMPEWLLDGRHSDKLHAVEKSFEGSQKVVANDQFFK